MDDRGKNKGKSNRKKKTAKLEKLYVPDPSETKPMSEQEFQEFLSVFKSGSLQERTYEYVTSVPEENFKNAKPTQGHKKLEQYIEDLIRNEDFLKKLLQFKEHFENEDKEGEDSIDELSEKLRHLFREYESLYEDTRWVQGEWVTMDILRKFAMFYGLDCALVMRMIGNLKGEHKDDLPNTYDFCDIRDNYEEYINPETPAVPMELDYYKHSHAYAYPVRIDIHKFATKRDVLDFVEKRWDIIQKTLGRWRPAKQIRFRERKQPREVLDFIWNNRSKRLKQVKKDLDEKFPETGLTYFEIGKIIELEKQRRSKKITKLP